VCFGVVHRRPACPRNEERKCPSLGFLLKCLREIEYTSRNEARKYLAGFLMDMHCPDIKFICPVINKEYFTVHSSFDWKDFNCKLIGKIVDRALKKCHNDVMDNCKKGWKNTADGCSIPLQGVKESIDTIFHSACDLHDLCYSSTNSKKDNCDDWFLHNMEQICNHQQDLFYYLDASLPDTFNCLATASLMYNTVKYSPEGQSSFNKSQEWVRDHCISGGFNQLDLDMMIRPFEAEWGV